MQILGALAPLMVEYLVDVLQFVDALVLVAEQVIEVPKIKIILEDIPSRLSCREKQLAEQLVEVPTVLSLALVEEAATLSSSRPAVQQPSMEAAVAFDTVEHVECHTRSGGWPLKTGPGSTRSYGGLRGFSDQAVVMAGLAVVVVGVSGIMQFKFQQSFEFTIVPQIQFIVRVLDIAVMPQRQVRTVPHCAGDRAALAGAVLGMVVDTPVVVQRQVPWQGTELKTVESATVADRGRGRRHPCCGAEEQIVEVRVHSTRAGSASQS